MMAFMDLITDKPEWQRKVHDETIVAKWKAELETYRRELGVIAKKEREESEERERERAAQVTADADADADAAPAAAAEDSQDTPMSENGSDDDNDDDMDDGSAIGTDELDDIMNGIHPINGESGEDTDDTDDDDDDDNSRSSDGVKGDDAAGESTSDDVAGRQAAADAAYARLPKGLQKYFDGLDASADDDALAHDDADASGAGDGNAEGDVVSFPPKEEGERYVDWSGDGDSADTLAAPFPYNRGFTDKMFEYCIKELREKAGIAEASGVTSVLESSACVLKSDSIVPEPLRLSLLKLAYAELEDVPEEKKDWHPGSDEIVLDLVHPSLFPLVYGRTRVLKDRVITSPEEALELTGAGEVVSTGEGPLTREQVEIWVKANKHYWCDEEEKKRRFEEDVESYLSGEKEMKTSWQEVISRRFQWLPAEVSLSSDSAKFTSYINNLHPVKHKALYGVLEDVLAKMLPMLDAAIERCMTFDASADSRKRIDAMRTIRKCTTPQICGKERYCYPDNRPRNAGGDGGEEDDDDYDSDDWEANDEWFAETHPVVQPNPGEYRYVGVPSFRSSGFFDGAPRIQVIVKLANIHLTPEKPAYAGGSWHLEGQLNERIAATALYYYDCDNITESRLSFRTPADAEEMSCEYGYEQSDFAGPQALFDINTDWDEGHTLMDHGSLLTRQGRTIVFPNVYQHHVEPFELADKTRAGHRKILAFFLVDPKTKVASTENVPPQQAEWGGHGQRAVEQRLPVELVQQVMKDVECPYGLDVAKEIRLELMKERSALESTVDKELKTRTWNFCEH